MKAGMALAIIGGLLVLVGGLAMFAGVAQLYAPMVEGATIAASLAVLFGLITLVGGWWSGKPGKESVGAIIVIIFSLLGLLVGGGWIVGSILGIIGGVLVWMKR